MIEEITAHIDEAGAQLPSGRRLYVIAAVLTSALDHQTLASTIVGSQLNGRPWHYYDETSERRLLLARLIAAMPIQGALVSLTTCAITTKKRPGAY